MLLAPERILLGSRYASKEEVIQAIGRVMLDAGDVTALYVDGMLEKEKQWSTWITEHVALPHGTNDVKDQVLRDSLVVVQIPEGVDWGQGKTVRLAIGFAGTGTEQHLNILADLARVLQHPELVERLATTGSREEVLQILNGSEAAR